MPPDAQGGAQQQSQVVGGGNIVIQQVGTGHQVIVGSLPHLTLVTHQARRAAAPKTELDLLDPFRRTIELVGRDRDLDDLWAWLHTGCPVAVRTIIGRAGAGKTRIAVELIERCHAEEPGRWDAGFATGREMARFAAQQHLAQWDRRQPTLVVIDYAAAHVQPISAWLHDLAETDHPQAVPLRILLLEREASTDRGWLRALYEHSWNGTAVNDLFDPFEPITLTRFDERQTRAHVMSAAMNAAAKLTGKPAPPLAPVEADPVLCQSLDNPIWADPLYLMMAAVLAVGAELPVVQVLGLSRTDLAFGLADRELRRLRTFANDDENLSKLLKHLAACATLAGGLPPEDAVRVVEEELLALRRGVRAGVVGARRPGGRDGPGTAVGPGEWQWEYRRAAGGAGESDQCRTILTT